MSPVTSILLEKEAPPLKVARPVTVRVELSIAAPLIVTAPAKVVAPVEAMVKSLRLLPFKRLNDSEVTPAAVPPAVKMNLAWLIALFGRKVMEVEEPALTAVVERMDTLDEAEDIFKT